MIATAISAVASCSQPAAPLPVETTKTPADTQHAGITTPHGDHTPRHGGMVLMNGEMHYEVVFDRGGKHRIWFSNAVREDLPASVASQVKMIVQRPPASPELLTLEIDDSGESWVASGRPVAGSDAMVTISYVARGEPFEIEIPFVK
ncbi:MAG: hypothetical protein Q7R30_04630 [Acidobacteriota bacterium]|nr:hypothetical protein [Acidobacteriota bacterium]